MAMEKNNDSLAKDQVRLDEASKSEQPVESAEQVSDDEMQRRTIGT